MNNKFFKRTISAFISVFLIISNSAVFAETNDIFVSPSDCISKSDENKDTRIIIELEDSPLLSYSEKINTYSTVSDFFSSKEAKEIEQKLEQNRKSVKKSLVQSGMDFTVKREYSTIMNGLAVEANVADLDAIKQTDGVKDAFVAEFYSLPEPIDTYSSGGVSAIGGDIVGDLGFTGKNSAVAILDTGLDLSHPAFSSVNTPKYSKEDIESVIKNNKMTIGKLNVSKVYINDKIPYAYDYADVDTNVSGGESHGTHVAGIVGANSGGVVEGVAPDAQLFIMKVFGDSSGGAYDDDILAALDDSVKFGVDVINMSLGSTAGFSESAYKSMREIYNRVKNSGIALYCAAGNEYSSTYENAAGNDLPKATEPDNGVVASPSTYEAALSVASMNNIETTSIYLLSNGRKIRYNDTAEKESDRLISLSGTFEYVDCGIGATTDFSDKNLKGKIALIQRAGEENGEVLTFAQKESNAKNAGALAAIIYDNVDGALINMSTDNKIPCVFISKTDGEYLCGQPDKKLSVSKDYVDTFKDNYSGKMSDFSSWGVTSDLKLKPEITAPGGDIYSTLPNGLYGNMSGTSMASPHMAGAAAVMQQYISENRDGINMTAEQRTSLFNALMMSTPVHVQDENGQKMSKSKGNAVDPFDALEKHGADAIRWYFYSNSAPWLPNRFHDGAVSEGQRKFMGTLWNTYAFFVLYANIDEFDATKYTLEYDKLSVMDKWLLSKLNTLVKTVDDNLANYKITETARVLDNFVDELSNWYVRRSRARFWVKEMTQDKINAYMTLYTALVTLCKAAAPMIPFMTEDIYQNLVRNIDKSAPESIHLCDFPEYDEKLIDKELENDMEEVLDIVVLGRACRNTANIKNRQPIGMMYVKAPEALSDFYIDIIEDELNVKKVEFTDDVAAFTAYSFKPQLKTLGRRFGKNINAVREILANIDGSKAMAELKETGSLKITVDGNEESLAEEDLLIESAHKEGFESNSDYGITVVLDTNLSEELIEEGFVREVISKIQTMRKDSDFEVMDHIKVSCEGNDKIAKIITDNESTIKDETLADEVDTNSADGNTKEWNINGEKVTLGVKKL